MEGGKKCLDKFLLKSACKPSELEAFADCNFRLAIWTSPGDISSRKFSVSVLSFHSLLIECRVSGAGGGIAERSHIGDVLQGTWRAIGH